MEMLSMNPPTHIPPVQVNIRKKKGGAKHWQLPSNQSATTKWLSSGLVVACLSVPSSCTVIWLLGLYKILLRITKSMPTFPLWSFIYVFHQHNPLSLFIILEGMFFPKRMQGKGKAFCISILKDDLLSSAPLVSLQWMWVYWIHYLIYHSHVYEHVNSNQTYMYRKKSILIHIPKAEMMQKEHWYRAEVLLEGSLLLMHIIIYTL